MRPLFSTLILLFLFEPISAQDNIAKNHLVSIKENMNVNIELEGEISLYNWDLPKAEIKVETIIKGRVLGYDGNRKTRKNYDVTIEESEDTIKIVEKPTKSSFMLGISTINVRKKHDIHLPKSVRISIRANDATIYINGNFESLDIDNKNGDCELKLSQESIKYLGCFANDGKIVVNGSNKNKRFILLGDGVATYSIATGEGLIKIFFTNADGTKINDG